ncbi:MAG: S8 family serine peptidase [Thermodesulfobacteriota bacterium]
MGSLKLNRAVNGLSSISPLDLVKLSPLMEFTSGRPEITIGLIDGPVAMNHHDLARQNIREVPGKLAGTCSKASSAACMHGTFVAGILCGKRGSAAPAICPNCTLLIRPIFAETTSDNTEMPSSTPQELTEALIDCIDAGAHVINLSAALAQPSSKGEHKLEEALDYAARRGVIVVAAAGNQGTIGSSAITRHPWVIPVVACDLQGRPISYSNLGSSIGRRGMSAPGDKITSLAANGKPLTFGGTSAAAPFVTGAIALVWSAFSAATAAEVKFAVTQAYAPRRTTVVPPLLNAWTAYQVMPVLSLSKGRLI